MDRDNRWERVERAYRLLTEASPVSSASPLEVVKAAHSDGTSDEFLEPVRFAPELIEANDALVLFNFRPDRMRQLTAAFVNSNFQGFERQLIGPLPVVTFTQYDKTLPVAVAFPPNPSTTCSVRWWLAQGCAVPHSGNREISPRHLFPQRRDGKPFPGRIAIWSPPPRWPPTTNPRTSRLTPSPMGALRQSARGSIPLL